MGYRILGDNVDYTLPDSVDVRDLSLDYQQVSVKLPGMFGAVSPTVGYPQGAQTVEVDGLIKSTSASALATAMQNFARAFNVGAVYRIEDTTLGRWAVAKTIAFGHARIPSGAKVVRVRARIVLLEGGWRSTLKHITQGVTFESFPNTDAETFKTTASASFLGVFAFTYNGSVPVAPVLTFTLNSGVTWTPSLTFKGGNLLRNASFEDGANQPDGWRYANNPKPVHGSVRTGHRAMRVSSTDYVYQDAYINVGNIYGLSAYYAPNGVALVAKLQVDWLSNTDGVVSTSNATDAINSTDAWGRVILSTQSPAGSVKARCRLEAVAGGTILVDDAQFEDMDDVGMVTPFVASKHVDFSRDAAITGTDWAEYAVDMEAGTVRLMDSTSAWTDDLGNVTGMFFELQPGEGKQHIEVNPPSGTDLPGKIWYQMKHIW